MTATSQARGLALVSLAVAFAATGALVIGGGPAESEPATPGGRVTAAAAWPAARVSTIDDLPLRPLLFLDTATVVGTAPSEDDRFLRLLLRAAAGEPRELRRMATAGSPRFENLTAAGDDVVWTEFADGRPPEIWAASIGAGGPARRLTADTGAVLFHGSEYDLVHHDGRVYWTTAPEDGAASTEIRSVSLRGGPVRVDRLPGEWTMAAWPWLDDGASGGAGATLLRNMSTGREITVPTTAGEFAACSPTWCRVMVTGDDGLSRIDLMRPDGSDRIDLMRPDGSERRRIAGGTARTAVPDVAVLDRFEILAGPGPRSGTAALLVHDIRTGETLELDAAANDTQSRGGLVWWYSTSTGAARWHVVDLRTA
ncbi:hypothetical protein [Actinoplanes utahensis]|uniref:Lipoprotein LpqB beta-propeller domain-containing protein n=1 Tax=Actinoplanes utahensis TaxID=1869 RepID=A0A0A6UQC0_ACTUT|nr:hypothetical protein [Actinoplanes utahensis]KHD77233.1 hypothetical protein MB27_12425 [Actinoplanes utahensis]GIF33535.1 hypothetical protein Aut01nite_65210 [Actinoplanes utahensis]